MPLYRATWLWEGHGCAGKWGELMKPERWHHIESLFHAALERRGEERAVFLQQACGDDESLRCEVE